MPAIPANHRIENKNITREKIKEPTNPKFSKIVFNILADYIFAYLIM
jgi:hypothetical protein